MTIAANILPMTDRYGKTTYDVWIYDTDQPRVTGGPIMGRYRVCGFLDTFKSRKRAEAAVESGGYPYLSDVERNTA
jgi:hypothetical protein